jgi:hypothetical protein
MNPIKFLSRHGWTWDEQAVVWLAVLFAILVLSGLA